ncbi:MAG: esterase family protein [Bacteroidales bacterium]|nr:esterase family protein [Bacteroidales bacterium]
MKRIIIFLAFLLASVSLAAQSEIVTGTMKSAKLGVDQGYNIYLPDGYDSSKHYPVIYLLHGLWGSYPDWVKQGRMQTVADQLIESGEVVPVVIIMPNAGDSDVINYQNGYFNVPGWPYEDFFYEEFLPAVENKYNCGGSKGQRAIMGLSMGGGGCTVYAQRHPDMYSSCYAMSAWLDNKDRADRGGSGSKLLVTDRSVREHSALDFVDNADAATLKALRSVKWFFDIGDEDHHLVTNVTMFTKMKARGIKAELRVRDGVHNWEYWHTALFTALPFASRNFSR